MGIVTRITGPAIRAGLVQSSLTHPSSDHRAVAHVALITRPVRRTHVARITAPVRCTHVALITRPVRGAFTRSPGPAIRAGSARIARPVRRTHVTRTGPAIRAWRPSSCRDTHHTALTGPTIHTDTPPQADSSRSQGTPPRRLSSWPCLEWSSSVRWEIILGVDDPIAVKVIGLTAFKLRGAELVEVYILKTPPSAQRTQDQGDGEDTRWHRQYPSRSGHAESIHAWLRPGHAHFQV